MNKKNIRIVIVIVLIAIVFAGAYLFNKTKSSTTQIITNFEECAKAGYPVGESYPRQCWTPDGKHFTESVNNSPNKEVFCAMDAKLCPDGLSVGRVGSKCEFAPCPGIK